MMFIFVPSNPSELKPTILQHLEQLVHPMDSWLEENLQQAALYGIQSEEGVIVGYYALQGEMLRYFYVAKPYFRYAATLFETVIQEHGLNSVFIMTQDQALVTLLAEWDYSQRKMACFFTDSQKPTPKASDTSPRTFRVANSSDVAMIHDIAHDFFDDQSNGFNSLEERVQAETIFVLEEGDQTLGFGIIEKSLLTGRHASIGMFVNPMYRKKGAARDILIKLKSWCYQRHLQPVSGCWFYNSLSRKSLESADMIVSAIGFEAKLLGKEKPPLRTGNPPGELVEE